MTDSDNVKVNKTKKSIKNVFSGLLLKIFELLMPFAVRTVLIYVLGNEYLGLNSLFTSILNVLSIAELGIGTCMVVHMYKPVNDGDTEKICALMGLYRFYYRIIGIVILVLGCAILPFLPKLIHGDVPSDLNLYVLYGLNLATTVISYWLFAYRNCLFNAHQRLDIVNNITFIISIIKYSLQIAFLLFFKNYYYFLIVSLITQIMINLITGLYSKRRYPNYYPTGKIDVVEKKKINKSIRDLFTYQLGYVVTISVDSIIISAFLGLVTLGIYNNYYYIITSIIAFFTIFYNSIKSSIGNNLINKTIEQNYNDFKFIGYLIFALLAFSSTCLLCLYQPFMKIWVGEENMLDIYMVILFVIFLICNELYRYMSLYKDAKGMWHKDRFRPLIAAIVNLIVNIILVNIIGLYGIILSTIISYLLINIPWLYFRVFKDVFVKEYKSDFVFFLFKYILLICMISGFGYFICIFINTSNEYLNLLFKLIIASGISVILYLLFNIKTNSQKRVFKIIKRVFVRR